MPTLSVTISPPYEVGGHEAFNIRDFTKKISQQLYVIGKEEGKNGKIHYQIGITLDNYKRCNFIRDYIKPFMLKQFDISKHSVALVINVHNDEKYLFGYCMKENNYVTNIPPIYKTVCQKHYTTTKVENKQQFHTCKDKISNDEIAQQLIQHCQDKDYGLCDDGTYREFMKSIKYKFSFTQFSRLNKDKLLEYVNFHLSGETKKNKNKIFSLINNNPQHIQNNQNIDAFLKEISS